MNNLNSLNTNLNTLNQYLIERIGEINDEETIWDIYHLIEKNDM